MELQEQKGGFFIIRNEKSISWRLDDTLPSRFINEIPEDSVENEIGINEKDEFEFNQDNSIELEGEYRSPGWDRYKKNKILKWKK